MKWLTMLGLAFLLAGVALVLLTAPLMGSEVVGRGAVMSNAEYSTLGPHDLSAGTYTVWMEDIRGGPEFADLDVYLTSGNEEHWANSPDDRRTQDWEGVRCELLAIASNVPGGEWSVELENYDTEWNATNETVAVFLVRSPGSGTVGILALGSTLAFLGVLFVLMARWPGEEG